MKASELRELTIKELQEKLDTEKGFLAKQRLNHAVSQLDNPLKIKEARKNIARISTALRAKEIQEENK
ncbi:MAG: 50S ribosomal protein L29 [Bacteroidota bacterium]|nr:MAG: 50S ribosomal protein L29 [Bacteroidota bacterium]